MDSSMDRYDYGSLGRFGKTHLSRDIHRILIDRKTGIITITANSYITPTTCRHCSLILYMDYFLYSSQQPYKADSIIILILSRGTVS